jgi:hypothetical protein
MNKTVFLLACGLILSGISKALCDTPLPAPQKIESWSPDHTILAVADPDTNTTSVFRASPNGVKTKLWSMVGWYRDVHVSNDGGHLVIGYDGLNLIPSKYRKDMLMLYFVEKGQLISMVTLGELIGDLSKLHRTVSNYEWGSVKGFNGQGRLEVSTVDRQRIFDVGGKRMD